MLWFLQQNPVSESNQNHKKKRALCFYFLLLSFFSSFCPCFRPPSSSISFSSSFTAHISNFPLFYAKWTPTAATRHYRATSPLFADWLKVARPEYPDPLGTTTRTLLHLQGLFSSCLLTKVPRYISHACNEKRARSFFFTRVWSFQRSMDSPRAQELSTQFRSGQHRYFSLLSLRGTDLHFVLRDRRSIYGAFSAVRLRNDDVGYTDIKFWWIKVYSERITSHCLWSGPRWHEDDLSSIRIPFFHFLHPPFSSFSALPFSPSPLSPLSLKTPSTDARSYTDVRVPRRKKSRDCQVFI